MQLQADGETRQTIRSALDEPDDIVPQTPNAAARVLAMRDELLQELRAIEEQGSLF